VRTHLISKYILFLVCSVLSIGAGAEEYRFGEVFVGYSLLHGDLQKRAGGWELSGGPYLNRWLSLHADFAAHHQSAPGSLRHEHDLLFGPQVSHRVESFTLFAHSLAGISHVTGFASDTGFAYAAGGGVDWDFGFVAFRMAQVDYHHAQLFGEGHNQLRFSAGVVFRVIGFRDFGPRKPPPPPDKPQTQLLHRHETQAARPSPL
jgi:hypothetical protein